MINKNYNILDCETFDSTIRSLEHIFKTPSDEIIKFIKNFDLDKVYEFRKKEIEHVEYKELLYQEFRKSFILGSKDIKSFWFHTTRADSDSDFKEGIYPLVTALPIFDRKINQIASTLGLAINEADPITCDVIKSKLNYKGDNGPWGFLIKEVCYHNIDSSHNYCNVPEIVEDIAFCKYGSEFSTIIKIYQDMTTPCIIKYSTHENLHPDRLVYVLNYLYQKIHNIEYDIHTISCRSNGGELINYDRIQQIDFYEHNKIIELAQ